MRKSEDLCYLCVYPYALDYRRSRAGPPSYVRGTVAEHAMRCTRCGAGIPKGRGYVHIRGTEELESRDPVLVV